MEAQHFWIIVKYPQHDRTYIYTTHTRWRKCRRIFRLMRRCLELEHDQNKARDCLQSKKKTNTLQDIFFYTTQIDMDCARDLSPQSRRRQNLIQLLYIKKAAAVIRIINNPTTFLTNSKKVARAKALNIDFCLHAICAVEHASTAH